MTNDGDVRLNDSKQRFFHFLVRMNDLVRMNHFPVRMSDFLMRANDFPMRTNDFPLRLADFRLSLSLLPGSVYQPGVSTPGGPGGPGGLQP